MPPKTDAATKPEGWPPMETAQIDDQAPQTQTQLRLLRWLVGLAIMDTVLLLVLVLQNVWTPTYTIVR